MKAIQKSFQAYLQGLQASYQKTIKNAKRRREQRRRASRQDEVLHDANKLRDAQKKALLRSAARKAAEKRNEALQNFFQNTLRLSNLKEKAQTQVTRSWAFRIITAVALISLVGNVLMYFRYSTTRPLVTIGQRVISKGEYQLDLDGTAGKAVLSRLVFNELIRQAATKANLMPSEMDIQQRIADLQRRGTAGFSADDPNARAQVETTLALENLRTQGITASQSEITAYYAQHKGDFARPAQVQTSLVLTQKASDAALAARLLADNMTEQDIAAHPSMHVAGINGFNVNLGALPPALRTQVGQIVMSMHDGDIKTLRIGNVFLTFKARQHEKGELPPLPAIKDQIAHLVKLQKAPSEQIELASLYKSNKPSFDMQKYAQFFSDIDQVDSTKPSTGPKTASLP